MRIGESPDTVGAAGPRWHIGAALLAPALVIFIYPMVGLIARNGDYFGGNYAVGRWVYAAGAVYFAVGLALYAGRRLPIVHLLFVVYVLSAPAAWLHSLLLVAAPSAATSVVVLAALIGCAAWLSRRGAESSLRVLGAVAAILVLTLGLSVARDAWAAQQTDEQATVRQPQAPAEADRNLPNVYHLVLDEFQTEMFNAVLDDGLRRELAGFTHFPETLTPYGRTDMALASMFALSDYAYDEPPLQYVREAYAPGTSALRALEAAGYQSTGYLHSIVVYGRQPPFADLRRHRQAPGVDRPGYSALATSLWIYSQAPDSVARALLPARHYEQLAGQALLPDDIPAISVAGFRTFLRDEPSRPAHGRYTYVHLIVPHFPNVLEADCSYVPDRDTEVVEQTGCAVRLIRQMIDALRKLDRFDDSMIVIQGDHGSRYAVTDDRTLDHVADQGAFSVAYSEGRSRPLLLVKPPGAGGGELATSSIPASITDVMPTIFDQVGIKADFEDSRSSVFADDFPKRPQRYYHFYDQHPQRVIDSPLHRYIVRNGRIAVDRRIPVP